MMRVAIFVTLVGFAAADFIRLQEVCRAEGNNGIELGLCVSSPFCCTALGGTIGKIVTPIKERSIARDLTDDDGNKGCSYNGECCIFPEIDDFSCEICGLKGNGEIGHVEPGSQPVVTTTTPVPETVTKLLVERIVNGESAERNEWCWQVAMMNASGIFGGATLISRNWVVTAAHKIAGRFLDEFVVVLGEYDFSHEDKNSKVYYTTALNAIIHPGFNPQTFDYNIALLRIPDAPCDEDNVCAACLNQQALSFEATTTTTTAASTTTVETTTTSTTTTTYAYGGGQASAGFNINFNVESALDRLRLNQRKRVPGGGAGGNGGTFVSPTGGENPFTDVACFMTGWGATGVTQLAPELQEAAIGIIRTDDCVAAFEQVGVVSPIVPAGAFCGAEGSQTRGSCYGDGGGPLVCQNRIDHTWELWGVISLGTNMCMLNAEQGPSIFTDVGAFYDWIITSVHEDLPTAATKEDIDRSYQVPECGANVSKDGTEPCPDSPPYVSFSGRSNLFPSNKNYNGISQQQLATLHF